MASFYRREVLQQALAIIWRKKYLWFLGLFAGLVAHGGEPDLLFRSTNSISWLQDNLGGLREVVQSGEADAFLNQLKSFFTTYPANALGFVGAIGLTLVAIFWLVIVSQAALVRIIGRTAEKKPTSLFEGLAAGAERFWPLVGVNVITKLFTWSLWIILAGLPAIAYFVTGERAWIVTFSLGSLLVTVPLSVLVSFLSKYAIAFITLADASVIDGLRRAWNLFRANWLVSIELAILVYAINLGAVIVVAGVTLLLFQTIASFTEFFILVFVLALAHAWISAFSYSAWTITYQKLLAGKGESKIGAWTTRLTNFLETKKSTS